ncbi:MAG TPA: hypothetical protein VLU25_21220 [Acidobacteriota bacterium]|nr:hypothetical protein [Acidobacteriota bacterium]
MFRQCYITHCDAAFLPLARVLAEGLEAFSSRPLILYAVNTEVDFAYPNLTVRRLDSPPGNHITYLKFRAMLDTPTEHGVYLDADHVPTPSVDEIFQLSRPADEDYPLLPRHPSDLKANLVADLMENLQVDEKNLPYLHSCCMSWTPRCRSFLRRCWSLSRRFDASGRHPFVWDESLVNVLLWKRRAERYLPCLNIDKKHFPDWVSGTLHENREFRRRYAAHPFRLTTFHGCKSEAGARRMLDAARSKRQEPRSQARP